MEPDNSNPPSPPAATVENYDIAPSPIPWENRREVSWPFWKTVGYVLRRGGRMSAEMDAYLELRSAKKFRWIVLFCAMLGFLGQLTVGIMLLAGALTSATSIFDPLGADSFRQSSGEAILAIAIIGFVFVMILWLLLFFIVGVTKWFLCPASLGPQRQENALCLCYYLTAPLVFLVFTAPLATWLGVELQEFPILRLAPLLLVLGPVVWWYALIVSGLRHIAGKTGGGVTASALALLLTWAVLLAGFVAFLPSLAMWFLMYASLA